MIEPAVETLPWAEQKAADEPRYRRQLDHLFENSRFYRGKLRDAALRGDTQQLAIFRIDEMNRTLETTLREILQHGAANRTFTLASTDHCDGLRVEKLGNSVR